MKKLFCFSILLVTFVVHSALWDEKVKVGEKWEDCIKAIKNNDIKFFQDNDEEIVHDVGFSVYNMESLIVIAAKNNRTEIVKILIEAGIDLDYYKIEHPLCSAMKNNNKEMFTLLLENGANPYKTNYLENNIKQNSFCVAIEKDSLEFLKILIEADKKYNFREWGGSASVIHKALIEKKEDIALLLIESDEDGKLLDAIGGAQYSALQVAYQFNQFKAADVLMNYGANLNNQSNKYSQRTALHEAAEENNKDIINQLIEHGAHPAIKNSKEKLAEELTDDEDIKLFLKNARNIKEWCTYHFYKNSEQVLPLIQSFPLLSFAMQNMKSKYDFSLFYKTMNSNEKYSKAIAQLLDKEVFKDKADFKHSLLDKAKLRLKARLYNTFILTETEYLNKFGEKEFKKMLITAKRIKKYDQEI